MATEASLSAAIIKGMFSSGHYAYKASDRFTIGVSDICGVSRDGRALAIETKLVPEWPARDDSRALKRPITYQQLMFLDAISSRGGFAWVAVGHPPVSGGRGICVQLFRVNQWRNLSLLSFSEGQNFIGENVSAKYLKRGLGKVLEGNISKGLLWP